VANGGTGASIFSPNNYLIRTNSSGIFDTSAVYEAGGNVGIGTTTPSYKLHLKDAGTTQLLIEGTNSTLQSSMYFTNNRSTAFTSYGGFLYGGESQTSSLFGIVRNDKLFLFADGANNLGMIVGTVSNQPLFFGTNNSVKLIINSHGDLSTNVSSLMTTPWKSFEIGTGVGTMVLAGRTDGANNLILGTNWTYDGGVAQEFIGSGYSSQYFQENGNHIIRSSSASGSAGANITFNEIARFTKEGNVGIGTASPQSGYRLHVVDSVYVGGNVSASAYTTRSDYNLKDDIFDLKYGLNDILQLQPVEYTYKSNGSKQLGFIAQDIGTILPEVVSFEESMSVNYQAIIPILTKAIQEQNLLIKALEQRIINLENK
jgi:hypothetical protein